MDIRMNELAKKKYFYPVVFTVFTVISFLPPITQKLYVPEQTQLVIIELLKIAIKPYESLGSFFHFATILLIVWLLIKKKPNMRVVYFYIGIDLILIALAQSIGTTEIYGKVIHTGGLISFSLLGFLWIFAAVKTDVERVPINLNWKSLLLLPFAILSFWSPYQVISDVVLPNPNLLLLLTSPDYGLTFCFTAPVFLYLLYILFPQVHIPMYRITAFVALLYALFNLTHWLNPATYWMGFLHIPLLVFSITALIQSRNITKHLEKSRGMKIDHNI